VGGGRGKDEAEELQDQDSTELGVTPEGDLLEDSTELGVTHVGELLELDSKELGVTHEGELVEDSQVTQGGSIVPVRQEVEADCQKADQCRKVFSPGNLWPTSSSSAPCGPPRRCTPSRRGLLCSCCLS